MFLSRLIYYSTHVHSNNDENEIEDILNTARKKNKKKHITGALYFNGSYFLQVLEGERNCVCETYHCIEKDSRHTNLQLVSFSSESQRLFSDWSMAYYADIERNRNKVIKFNTNDEFVPDHMSTESITAMLLALKE